jgi:hypothetical protein
VSVSADRLEATELREKLIAAVNGNPVSADDAWALIHTWDGLLERVRSLEAANERLERILYPPDSPPREDASGEASQSEVVVTAAASATGLPQCTCKWGASGAHNDGCPCAVLDVASPANGVNYTGPQPSVPCAYQPCTNRLLLKAGWGPQFCSEEHRSLGVASPAHPEAEPECDACGNAATGYGADGQWCEKHFGSASRPRVSSGGSAGLPSEGDKA